MNWSKMRLIGKFGVNSFYIMVVHEIIKIKVAHVLQIFYSVRDLKIVMVIVSAVKSLVKCIVCNTVKGAAIYPATVIAVDDFAHQPEIRLHFLSGAAQLFHKIKVQNVRSVKTDTIHIKFRNPETDHIADVVLHIRITLV